MSDWDSSFTSHLILPIERESVVDFLVKAPLLELASEVMDSVGGVTVALVVYEREGLLSESVEVGVAL